MENITKMPNNKRDKHAYLFNTILKNASEISEKIKDIDILAIVKELRELNSACSDLKDALGQLNEPSE